jgi:hypothetical protein
VTVTRLVGGLTPGDGSDPRTFPAIWNATADVIDAQDSAISALESDSLPTAVGSAVAGQKLVFDGTNWVNLTGYVFVSTVYFTSSGTFTKATYPWLRAIRVMCQGGGGAGGGAVTTGSDAAAIGGGGGGGVYAESFITNIAGLDASVTITRGAGGSGVSGGTGNSGATSSFGSLVSAGGGFGAGFNGAGSANLAVIGAGANNTGTGDLVIPGKIGQGGMCGATSTDVFRYLFAGGGDSHLGAGATQRGAVNTNAFNGFAFGGGGGGAVNSASQGTARTGGAGGNGIVIVELYA